MPRLCVPVMLVATLVAAGLPTAACGARDGADAGDSPWVPLGTAAGSAVWLDTERLDVDGTAHTVWLRTDFAEPLPVPGQPGKRFWALAAQHRLDCPARTVTDLRVVTLDSAGTEMRTIPSEGGSWKTFADHPLGAEVFPLACRWLQQHRPVRR